MVAMRLLLMFWHMLWLWSATIAQAEPLAVAPLAMSNAPPLPFAEALRRQLDSRWRVIEIPPIAPGDGQEATLLALATGHRIIVWGRAAPTSSGLNVEIHVFVRPRAGQRELDRVDRFIIAHAARADLARAVALRTSALLQTIPAAIQAPVVIESHLSKTTPEPFGRIQLAAGPIAAFGLGERYRSFGASLCGRVTVVAPIRIGMHMYMLAADREDPLDLDFFAADVHLAPTFSLGHLRFAPSVGFAMARLDVSSPADRDLASLFGLTAGSALSWRVWKPLALVGSIADLYVPNTRLYRIGSEIYRFPHNVLVAGIGVALELR